MKLIPNQAEDLFVTANLSELARGFYRHFCAQIANRMLTEASVFASHGSAIMPQNRLLVRKLSVRVMETILALMTALALSGILLLPSYGFTLQDTSTVAGLSTILVRSPEFVNLLQGAGSGKLSRLQRCLEQSNLLRLSNRSPRCDILAFTSKAPSP